jgi:Leucine-rich repeat (LRR) protein
MDAVHYQRAVTPTIASSSSSAAANAAAANAANSVNNAADNNVNANVSGGGSVVSASNTASGNASPSVRGKILSYQSHSQKDASARSKMSMSMNAGASSSSQGPILQINMASGASSPSTSNRFSVTGRSAQQPSPNGNFSGGGGGSNGEINIQGKSHMSNMGVAGSSATGGSKSLKIGGTGNDSVVGDMSATAASSNNSLGSLIRHDLVPLSEEIPTDGIIFARYRNQPDSLVVFRTPEERLRNPERLNLDRRQLEVCPVLEQEHRLRLLNFQNNSIKSIQNLENLSNLIFLDLYNNKLQSLEGPLGTIKGLRVLMAGKNRIAMISNLTQLRKLDVLDLHSNEIRLIEGLAKLTDLRVLNLAGMQVNCVGMFTG